MIRRAALGLAIMLASSSVARVAQAWEPFRAESRDVERGNEHMKKGQTAEALEAYETAAKRLPNEPGVQLNRGLALMAQGKPGPAREALRSASQGSAPPDIRSQALYDLGLSFMQEADKQAKSEDLEGAQKLLRESVDAFKGSLRAKPGSRDAAWNLELAKRRLVDVEKKQQEKKKQEEEKKKEEQDKKDKSDEQKQDQDGGTPPESQPDAGADEPKPDDSQTPPQDPQDGKQGDQGDKPEDKQGDKGSPDKNDGQSEAPEPKPNEQGKPKDDAAQPSEEAPGQRLPEHMRKALDALSAGEENLEKVRAQARARQRPRRIEKDW